MKKSVTAALLVSLASLGVCEDQVSIKLAVAMYSSQRAWKVGDLLTVSVSESTSSSKSQAMSTAKNVKADATVPTTGTELANANSPISRFTNFLKRQSGKIPLAEYKVDASSSYDGSGSASSSESLNMNFTVRVVDVLDNGVLVVRGDRKVIMRSEKVSMVLTGLVRQRDITSANTVTSSQIADAHIYYETGGEVSRGANPGWVWRIFQFLNPF